MSTHSPTTLGKALALIQSIRDLEATIERIRSDHQNEDGYCVKCSEEYGLTTGKYPCPTIQALEES